MKGTLHPNGFVIRLLCAFRNGMRLRLHTWPTGVPRLESPHDHRSWFISIPLWGSFLERRYREEPSDTSMDVQRCHATTSGNGTPHVTFERTGGVAEVMTTMRRAFMPYFCPADAIHSFAPTSPRFAASLVLFGPPKRTPRVWLARTS